MEAVTRQIFVVLDNDAAARDILARGTMNLSALARWLQSEAGIDAPEHVVLAAVRRYAGAVRAPPFDRARRLLAQGHVNVRARVCILVLPKAPQTQARLPDLFRSVDFAKGETLRVIQTEKAIKIIIDEDKLHDVQACLGSARALNVQTRLTELNVVMPDECRETPGIIGVLSTALASRGINIVEAVSGLPEHLFLVADEDGLRAYEAFTGLIGASAAFLDGARRAEAAHRQGALARSGGA